MATRNWTLSSGGLWSTAANWSQSLVPTNLDDVVFTFAGTSAAIITAPGNAAVAASASMAVFGKTTLGPSTTGRGLFATGALTLGSATTQGDLLISGSAVTATSAAILYGPLTVNGAGSTLTVTGALTIGVPSGTIPGNATLTVSNGAVAQLGSLAMIGPIGIFNGVTVDSTSIIEIGTAGAAAIGKLTIDAGQTLIGKGSISAFGGIVNQGSIAATGYLTVFGPITGAGALQINPGATLDLRNDAVASTEQVVFTGTTGTLAITGVATPGVPGGGSILEQGAISGFAAGDTIAFTSPVAGGATSVSYQAATGNLGTLTLRNASATLGTLTLAGSYAGATFSVSQSGNVSNIKLTPGDPLFDAAYYRAQNPDIAAAGVDPYQHYMTYGWKEGRNPSALFNTTYYLNQNPDVKAAGINPLTHFETYGWQEGRDPSSLFSDARYLASYADVKAAGIDPLLHFIAYGTYEGRAAFAATPHPTAPQDALIDAAYVYAHNPAVAAAGQDATAWLHTTGWQIGANPNAFFDTSYYLAHNPDIAAAHIDPLLHYETYGWLEGRNPSAQFSTNKYLAAYTDVKTAGLDPLLHYVAYGQTEGRTAFAA